MAEEVTGCIELEDVDEARIVFGTRDRNLKLLKLAYGVNITARNGTIRITGGVEEVNRVSAIINHITGKIRRHPGMTPHNAETIINDYLSEHGGDVEPEEHGGLGYPKGPDPGYGDEETGGPDSFGTVSRARPRTPGQRRFMEAMAKNDLVFVVGPAGTGKTYLAVARAVDQLKKGRVRKIILTRPAVEAGEKLGFLPGDFASKVHPYLRPLFDALEDFMHPRQLRSLTERDTIEIAPLAYMRGRTLDRAFIILDEAQNTTRKQMKMFLTRMGVGSQAVITGDITQTDLLENEESGLVDAVELVKSITNIDICYLTRRDIVRHKLVQLIVEAYEDDYEKRTKTKEAAKHARSVGEEDSPSVTNGA